MKVKILGLALVLGGLFVGVGIVYACPNIPPEAIQKFREHVIVGRSVIFDGSESYDPDGDAGLKGIIEFEWDFEFDYNNVDIDYSETSDVHSDGLFDGKTTYTYTSTEPNNVFFVVTDDGVGSGIDYDIVIYEITVSVDSDDTPDDLPDAWELKHFGNLNEDWYDDYDNDDTYNNLCEYLHGTDPDDDESYPTENIVIRVPADATTIERALGAAISGDEIWVSAGTYKPGSSRSDTFELVEGVAVYGGFDGSETSRDQRDWVTNETILSGDISGDNCYHVVTGADDANLDGFTITGGNADGTGNDQYGGGILNIQASPEISNCEIKGNSAVYGGGIVNYGISTDWSLTNVTNCLFTENEADYGGAIYNNNYSWDLITNCTFSKNDASTLGGAIYDFYSYETDIVNSILWGDTDSAAENWEVISDGSWIEISYSDFGNMATANGGTINEGSGNLTTNPLFADADNGDFHLQSAIGRWNGSSWVTTDTYVSPCVSFGGNSATYSIEPTPNGGRINMGVYGNTSEASKYDPDIVVYVDKDNTTSPWLGTPSDPYETIQDGVDNVNSGGIVYVADGTYYENLSFDSGDDFSLIGVGYPIIDGDADDSVIYFNNADDMIVDGFYIIHGESAIGGGMRLDDSSPTIKNCRFAGNWAYNNIGAAWGGGIYIDGGSPLIEDCDFARNAAYGEDPPGGTFWDAGSGGGIHTQFSNATFKNCKIGVEVAWLGSPWANNSDTWYESGLPIHADEIFRVGEKGAGGDYHVTFIDCDIRNGLDYWGYNSGWPSN